MKKKKRKSSRVRKNILFRGRRMMRCEYCGKPLTKDTATIDHVRQLAAGGYDRLRKCVIACKACNIAKGAMSRDEFVRVLDFGEAA